MSDIFGAGRNDNRFTFTPVTLDLSFLPDFFNAKIAQNLATSPQSSSRTDPSTERGPATVLPPWDFRRDQPTENARLRQALTATSIIDRNDPTFQDQGVPEDLQKLFTLYRAVNTLTVLAAEAAKETTFSGQLPGLDRRFAAGLAEVNSFVGIERFNELTVLLGDKDKQIDTLTKTPRTSSSFSTGLIHAGTYTDREH